MLIVLEGIDGVGKTALAQLLAERFNGIVLRTPPKEYGLTGEYIDPAPQSPAHFFFYLSGALWISAQCRQLLDSGRAVICDRYVYSTFAYHRPFWLAPLKLDELVYPEPTVAFLLSVDESVRQARLRMRGGAKSLIETLVDDPTVRSGIMQEYRTFSNLIEVDTSGLTLDEVLATLLLHIEAQ